MRLAPLLLSLVLALPGCGAQSAPLEVIRQGEPFWLQAGQSAALADGAVSIRFAAVASDSRCPSGAVCVWAGEVTLDIGVSVPPAAERLVRLHQRTPPLADSLTGYRIELLEVTAPQPGAGARPPANAYRARLRLTRIE